MSNEPNTPEEGFDASVDAIAQLLDPAEDNPAPDSEEEEEEPESEASEESESEEEGTEEEQEVEQPEKAKLESLEIDGETIQLPAAIAAKIKPNLLRRQDYTRKTQEVAEIRKAAEQARDNYLQGLGVVHQALQSSLPPLPDEALLDTDPVEFMRQERAHKNHVQKLQALQQEGRRAVQQQQWEQQQDAQKAMQEAAAQLPELIPAWKDPAKAKVERAALREYLQTAGYSPEEIRTAADPRAIALSRKAWLFDQLMAQKKAAKPVPTKVEAPGSSKPKTNPSRAQKYARLRETGRTEDAAAFIESLL